MEILIWGDNMKRQMSISIILSILVIVLAWLYIKDFNKRRENNDNLVTENNISKEEAITISQEYENFDFYIKSEDGSVSVFHVKTQELFMETGIETYTLPNEIRNQLNSGIFFETEDELYDFLESYSS